MSCAPLSGRKPAPNGFSLVELLVTIAVIGIMSAIVITSINNAAQDSRLTMARQQQVVLQEALNSWITAQPSVTQARSSYAGASDKLSLVRAYLQPDTYDQLAAGSSSGQISSEPMRKAGVYLEFSSWTATNTPVVNLNQQ